MILYSYNIRINTENLNFIELYRVKYVLQGAEDEIKEKRKNSSNDGIFIK